MRYLIVFLALSLGLDACASSSRDGVGGNERNVITALELADRTFTDTYEAVRQLRPSWLRSRGPVSLSDPGYAVVYFDNMSAGGLESLRGIPIEHVAEIRFLSASDATIRFGTGYPSGIIMVITGGGQG